MVEIGGSTLLIVGAGPNQRPAIEFAKERGFRVVATDMNAEAVGFELADRTGVVSTRDVEATVEFAREVHREEPLDGVMTMASESAITVSRVADALGLPGVDPDAAFRATHKVERQRCFHEHGVPSPRFAWAETVEKATAHAEEIGWPVVTKPVDSAGARGVRKVSGPEEMTDAMNEVRDVSERPKMLIEEFLTGTEHSLEGIVVDGEIYWTGFSDRNYDKKERYAPHFLEDGDTLPTALSDEMKTRVIEASNAAVRALGIDFGPVKGDILIDEHGPKVLEMAARLSGDYFGYETVPLHNGTDIVRATMDQALDVEVDRDLLMPKYERGVALRYVWPEPGIVQAISGLEEARAMTGIHFVRWEPKWEGLAVGDEITPAHSMGERVGSVLAHADTRQKAVRRAEKAANAITIRTTEQEEMTSNQ